MLIMQDLWKMGECSENIYYIHEISSYYPQATCVKKVKKWFELKEILSMFSEIFSPYQYVLAALSRK